jgi:hypothetical protein
MSGLSVWCRVLNPQNQDAIPTLAANRFSICHFPFFIRHFGWSQHGSLKEQNGKREMTNGKSFVRQILIMVPD